jgi:hypothetical protein
MYNYFIEEVKYSKIHVNFIILYNKMFIIFFIVNIKKIKNCLKLLLLLKSSIKFMCVLLLYKLLYFPQYPIIIELKFSINRTSIYIFF